MYTDSVYSHCFRCYWDCEDNGPAGFTAWATDAITGELIAEADGATREVAVMLLWLDLEAMGRRERAA